MMKPKDFLRHTESLAKSLKFAETQEIAVGLPKSSSLTRKVYSKKRLSKGKKKSLKSSGKGLTVLDVGIIHEFGLGKNPVRSFLRVPFSKKRIQINKAMNLSFQKISSGAPVLYQMERTGAFIKNISLGAFNSKGYGSWQNLKAATIARKGSNAILTDTATLKQSITYVVRNVS